jgi:hypothetical protein
MTPGTVVSEYRTAVRNAAKALEELAARCDEIDAIGGAQQLQDYVTGNAEALGFDYAVFSTSLATAGNFRNVLRNIAATFPVGSRTNIYNVRS